MLSRIKSIFSMCTKHSWTKLVLIFCTFCSCHSKTFRIAWMAPDQNSGQEINSYTSVAGLKLALTSVMANTMILNGHNIEIEYFPTDCTSQMAMQAAMKAKLFNPDVIIGPPCQEGMRMVAQLCAYWNLPVFTWYNPGIEFDTTVTYPTLVRMIPSLSTMVAMAKYRIALAIKYFGKRNVGLPYARNLEKTKIGVSLLHLLRQNNWNKFAYIYDDSAPWTLYEEALRVTLAPTEVHMLSSHGINSTLTDNKIVQLFSEIKKYSWVVVFAVPLSDIRRYMLIAEQAGMGHGKYFFIQLDHQLHSEKVLNSVVLTKQRWMTGDAQDQAAKRIYQSLIHVLLDPMNDDVTPTHTLPRNRYEEFVQMATPEASKQTPGWTLPVGGKPDVYSLYLYDAILVWSVLVDKLNTAGKNYRDGNLLTQEARTFFADGATGYFALNDNVDRTGKLFILYMEKDGSFKPSQILRFNSSDGYDIINVKPLNEQTRLHGGQTGGHTIGQIGGQQIGGHTGGQTGGHTQGGSADYTTAITGGHTSRITGDQTGGHTGGHSGSHTGGHTSGQIWGQNNEGQAGVYTASQTGNHTRLQTGGQTMTRLNQANAVTAPSATTATIITAPTPSMPMTTQASTKPLIPPPPPPASTAQSGSADVLTSQTTDSLIKRLLDKVHSLEKTVRQHELHSHGHVPEHSHTPHPLLLLLGSTPGPPAKLVKTQKPVVALNNQVNQKHQVTTPVVLSLEKLLGNNNLGHAHFPHQHLPVPTQSNNQINPVTDIHRQQAKNAYTPPVNDHAHHPHHWHPHPHHPHYNQGHHGHAPGPYVPTTLRPTTTTLAPTTTTLPPLTTVPPEPTPGIHELFNGNGQIDESMLNRISSRIVDQLTGVNATNANRQERRIVNDWFAGGLDELGPGLLLAAQAMREKRLLQQNHRFYQQTIQKSNQNNQQQSNPVQQQQTQNAQKNNQAKPQPAGWSAAAYQDPLANAFDPLAGLFGASLVW